MTLKMRSKVKFKVTRRFAKYGLLYVHNGFLTSKGNNKKDISHFLPWPWKWRQRSNSRSWEHLPCMVSYMSAIDSWAPKSKISEILAILSSDLEFDLWPHSQGHWTKWLISRLLLTLELRNQLRTYRKPYMANLLMTLNLTFDLIFKVIGENDQYLTYYWLWSSRINCGIIGNHMWWIFLWPWIWTSRSLDKMAYILLKIDLQGVPVSCRALGPIFSL